MSSDLTINQMNQLANKFSAMGWDTNRVTQLGQVGEDKYREIEAVLDDRAKVTIKSWLSAPTLITLPAVEKPHRLRDCNRGRLSPSAAALFEGSYTLPPAAVAERVLERRDIDTSCNDFELIDKLGGVRCTVFESVEELEVNVGQLIVAQQNDGSSHLLNGGESNIFFVRNPNYTNQRQVLYVVAYRDCDFSMWHIRCRHVNSHQWKDGGRVFRPATVA